MGERIVCVTGIGIVSPVGNTREEAWKNIVQGVSGTDYISQFDASQWPTRIACEVKDFHLDKKAFHDGSLLNRSNEFGMQSAYEAMVDSGLADILESKNNPIDPYRFGVSVGVGIGTIAPQELATLLRGTDFHTTNDFKLAFSLEKTVNSKLLMKNHPGMFAGWLASRWNIRGPTSTIHTACASSGQSLGQAYLQIKRSEADIMLAGGADSLAGELLLAGFCLLGALSTRNDEPSRASRPFDRDRDGFVASEGASMLVLEEKEHALRRGARIYAEVVGYGETQSAYRITDLPPDGRGVKEAMEDALVQAGMVHSDIDYINAHGTSTELNDRIEALAISKVFSSRGCFPYINSTKSETGHLISAAGALEASFSILSIRDSVIPPSINLDHPDCGRSEYGDLRFVANKKLDYPVKVAMSNSVGFGGTNTSLIFKGID